ncbi:hypothetical protein CHM34_08175 [Paludifilum halophilum]|uniref:Uncharacterized protein n=2 Tax=Paludifilum halophilum TaxID=1642702 RepID=A0A235B7B2_9BACL|nr:hypothetical protein [Paludifilum halophilum]OYD08208.1 hypothetical protein CHM34_08175 [Paludifilum halophilum]
MFAATALVVATGCSPDRTAEKCRDRDKDGYCDEEVCEDEDQDGYCDDGSGRTGSSHVYRNGKKVYKKISGVSSGSKSKGGGSGVSSGSKSKGGVGSSSSGGWFSGG